MSLSRVVIVLALSVSGLAACSSTQEHSTDPDFTTLSSAPVMRHNLREIVQYDSFKMDQMVNKEINLKEPDEDIFLRNISTVLAETVFIQPDFEERESALHEIKSKLEQEDYTYVISLASDVLLDVIQTSRVASDQATALVGLENLVVEARSLNRSELKPTLQKIVDAKIHVSAEAVAYAREPMDQLISPSAEALSALNVRK
jgi:hypothetical protein